MGNNRSNKLDYGWFKRDWDSENPETQAEKVKSRKYLFHIVF